MKVYDPEALGLKVARTVGNEATCWCPYHSDHMPSASFNFVKGVLYCFACGATKYANAIAIDLGGVVQRIDVKGLRSYADEAPEWRWILSCPLAHDSAYLKLRGVTNTEVDAFDIRELSDGVAFILHDQRGMPCGAQVRHIKRKPKYMLYGDVPSFWPYVRLFNGEYDAERPLFVVEGVFGVVRAFGAGQQAVAMLGAAKAGERLASELSCFKQVFVLMDPDFAGYKAALRLSYVSRGRIKAILPGEEADELSTTDWSELLNTHTVTSLAHYWRPYLALADIVKTTKEAR